MARGTVAHVVLANRGAFQNGGVRADKTVLGKVVGVKHKADQNHAAAANRMLLDKIAATDQGTRAVHCTIAFARRVLVLRIQIDRDHCYFPDPLVVLETREVM